jgi:hypothetical protein
MGMPQESKFDLTANFTRTSVVRFANGSLINAAQIDSNPFYDSWMLQALHASKTDNLVQCKQKPSRIRSVVVSFGLRISSWLYPKVALFVDEEINLASPEEEKSNPFRQLIESLKKETEHRVGTTIADVAVSFPAFFNSRHKSCLAAALKQAGLRDRGCHADGYAFHAAATASKVTEAMSPRTCFECIHGALGAEWILVVEYGSAALSAIVFQKLVGFYAAANMQHYRPVYIEAGPFEKQNVDSTIEGRFWSEVETQLRSFASKLASGMQLDRLVFIGTLAKELQLHELVYDVFGDKLRSTSGLGRITDLLLQSSNQSSTLSSRNAMETRSERGLQLVDPVFAAATGAALYGLESILFPCQQPEVCDVVFCDERRGLKNQLNVFLEPPGDDGL